MWQTCRSKITRRYSLRIFGFLNDTPIRASDEKGFTPGGALQLHLYGAVWPQDWKIDPSAD